MSTFILTKRLPGTIYRSLRSPFTRSRAFTSSIKMSTTLNSNTISKITEKEKELTGQDNPVKGGPTAQAQKHAGEQLSSDQISDITKGEKKITGMDRPVQGGPTSQAQSMADQVRSSCSNPTLLVDTHVPPVSIDHQQRYSHRHP